MYLTAHHVIGRPGHGEGINAFHYAHDGITWMALPPPGIPDEQPGVLQNQLVNVPPGGNRVRSYLDIITPDDTSWREIRQAFVSFVSSNQRNAFPWTGLVGRTTFRIGLELGLVNTWHREIADLYRAAQAVHRA